jgi:serine/threonine-protein phosphatase PGAM5
LGKAQAEATARRLLALVCEDARDVDVDVDVDIAGEDKASEKTTSCEKIKLKQIQYSTMARARETAEIISARAFPATTMTANELIREGAPVRPVPDTWGQKEHVHVTDAPRIEAGFRSVFHRATKMDEEESFRRRRAASAAETTTMDGAADASPPASTDEHEIVVCHGNVIRYSVLRALQLPPEAWLRIGLYNGSITRVDVRPDGRVSLRALGDAGHLPPSTLTHN